VKVEIDSHHLQQLQYAAREYADGRCTYIVRNVNEATAAMLDAGVECLVRNNTQTIWANDGHFGAPSDLIDKYGNDGTKARTA
jgi:hypothetical protein